MNIKQRIDYIRKCNVEAKKNINGPTYAVKHWRENQTLNLKIIRLNVAYLMFRIDNSRTEIQQLAYLRKNPSLPKNLFSDPESKNAQKAQEAILNQINILAGKDFFENLKTQGQDDPAIITMDGYLVNGNRRTAALKSLGVNYVDCVVLPEDTTPRDIYEQEQQLQITQDFREPYHWINELRNIKKGLEDKKFDDEKSMANRLRIDVREIKTKRRMLELMDSFLIWKNIRGQYDYKKLEDTEQIFIQLEKVTKKLNQGKKFEELKNAVFTLIEERPPTGRLYAHVMDLIRNFEQIYKKMVVEQPIKNKVKIKRPKQNKDILDSILENEDTTPSIFDNSSSAKKLASLLTEKIADVNAENKEKTDKESVYDGVSTALRELQGLKVDNDTSKINSVKLKLEEIISVSDSLLKQIKKVGKSK